MSKPVSKWGTIIKSSSKRQGDKLFIYFKLCSFEQIFEYIVKVNPEK